MTGRLQGQVAVITGAASGIGAATVRKFIAEGARVVIADMQADKGAALAGEFSDSARFILTDVCFEAQVGTAIQLAIDTWGRLDCMFNNAGFGGVTADNVAELDLGEPYSRTVDAMLKGPLIGIKHASAFMVKQGSGTIINTASIAGVGAGYGPHVYSGVKAAVVNLTRSVAQELGPKGVRVNAICPGAINTPIFGGQKILQDPESVNLAALEQIMPFMQPVHRAGQPEDIANAACFLASDEASFITGHALVVDGGITLGSWQHPDVGGGVQKAMSDILGVENFSELDTVFHAADDA